MKTTGRRFRGQGILPKRLLLLTLAALVLCAAGGAAFGGLEEELPNGRLGYQWVPEPPGERVSSSEQLWRNVAKCGGAVIAGGWLLKKLFGED